MRSLTQQGVGSGGAVRDSFESLEPFIYRANIWMRETSFKSFTIRCGDFAEWAGGLNAITADTGVTDRIAARKQPEPPNTKKFWQ